MAEDAFVYVIDDDGAMRDSLAFLLDSAGISVATFESASSFLEALPRIESGCVVTDVRMPGIDGIELLKRLKQEKPALCVIVITGHGEIPLAVQAMKLGAMDFLEKPFDDERLIEAVRSALASIADKAKADAVTAQVASRVAVLSPRERQVLEGLVAGHSNKTMARDLQISPRTVEVYRDNVMTKLQVANLSELVRLAMRAGVLKD
jgi:two-component system, LuxR family, response regulator FixJ